MLVAVVLLFAICWGPFLIDNVLVAFGYIQVLHMGPLKPLRMLFALLTYLNSCVNPVVYAFLSKNFRAKFKDALCSCVGGKNGQRRRRFGPQASFQTRTTSVTRGISATTTTRTDMELDKSIVNYSETCLDDSL